MKKIKMWIELLFIFLLPLIIMSLSVKIETTKEYDENNNEISKISNFTWEYPYNDFKDNNHIINYLKLNQNVINGNFSNLDNWSIDSTTYTATTNNNELKLVLNNDIENWNMLFNQTHDYSNKQNHKIFITFDCKVLNNSANEASCRLRFPTYVYTTFTPTNTYTRYNIFSYIIENNGNGLQANSYLANTEFYFKNFMIIDLTEMFGLGYEPETYQELTQYINLTNYIEYTEEETINYYTENTNISENWKYNYTIWGKIYNEIIINNLYLTDNITTRFILTYTITWFIMFIIWHTIYVPFDWLIHLVTPKEKE